MVKIDTSTYDHLGYAYAGTVHRSQGQTKTEAYHLASAGMTDRHLSLVAASRARASYKLYGAEGDLETLADRLGMDRLRVNALEEGRLDLAPSIGEITKGIEQVAQRRKQREKVGIGLDD
jgi:ATP-dependent exoDNAse (exonuclease V) alpha subunit